MSYLPGWGGRLLFSDIPHYFTNACSDRISPCLSLKTFPPRSISKCDGVYIERIIKAPHRTFATLHASDDERPKDFHELSVLCRWLIQRDICSQEIEECIMAERPRSVSELRDLLISLGVMPCPSRMAKLYAKLDITRRTVRVAKKQQVLLLYGTQFSISSDQEQEKEGAELTSLVVCGSQNKALKEAPRNQQQPPTSCGNRRKSSSPRILMRFAMKIHLPSLTIMMVRLSSMTTRTGRSCLS